jgi:hypothetical protein|tara:strand:- start:134 stop:301 length:168 start_codon:yes stop_codon:yes gene_type:complete
MSDESGAIYGAPGSVRWILVDQDDTPVDPRDHLEEAIADLCDLLDIFSQASGEEL